MLCVLSGCPVLLPALPASTGDLSRVPYLCFLWKGIGDKPLVFSFHIFPLTLFVAEILQSLRQVGGISFCSFQYWRKIFKMYEICPESIQLCTMKNRDICWRYKIQETLSIGQWWLSHFESRHLGTSHTVLPDTISCPVILCWILSTVWNLFPFKGDFSLGKSQKSQGAKS